ncbi:hypothetical protein Tco_1254553 [Tanacetum coccineum]
MGMNKKARTEEMEMDEIEIEGMEKTEMEIEMGIMDSALTWWNSHKRTIGVEVAYAMNWVELMNLLTEVYCPRNEIQKMETELWNLTVKGNDGSDCLHSKVMSSASSAVTYTFVYIDSEPGRVFWGADVEISDGGVPRVIILGYDGLLMQPVHPPSPDYMPGPEHPASSDYVPGPEHPPSPIEIPFVPEPEYPEYLVPSDDEAPMEDQPLPIEAFTRCPITAMYIDSRSKSGTRGGGMLIHPAKRRGWRR